MESKLPKPSALKKPMIIARSILPMDRIKTSSFTGVYNKDNATTFRFRPFSVGISANTIAESVLQKERASTSQEVKTESRIKLRRSRSACDLRETRYLKRHETTLAPIPAKTACIVSKDGVSAINIINNSTRFGASVNKITNPSTNMTIRSKIRRSRSACDVTDVHNLKRHGTTLAPITSKSTRTPLNLVSSITSNVINRPIRTGYHNSNVNKIGKPSIRAIPNRSVDSVRKATKGNASNTAVSTTGVGKTINKRIPPYDFKARYNDLLEKHKLLRSKFEEKCELIGNLENLPEQLEDTQSQLLNTQEQLKNIKIDNDCLQRQVNSQQQKLSSVTDSFKNVTEEFTQLKSIYDKLYQDHSTLCKEIIELRDSSISLTTKNADLTEEINICKDQLFRSNMERKELHNTVMDLKGNIRVFCRVRPSLECEQDKTMCGWNYIDEATLEIINVDTSSRVKNNCHTFSFDQVFHSGSSQEDIFEMVSPLIQSALDGYNICIFAYGQTGSGKTYTMDGIQKNPGVIPRTVDLLFEAIKNYRHLGWQYEIKVQFLEIYNEVLYDLLSNEAKDMEIRMVKNSKNDIYVSNITHETVKDAERLRHLMYIAKMNRATAATTGNERSSRSHAVTKIELIGSHTQKQEISIGSINLVDLAGSESPKTSIRMNETKNINRSLSELTNVILALLQKQDHIPYRNSKLTHLLMPSLGGNSKTLMFINVAPLQECFVESLKSLRFAATVNQCKMSKAKRNRILNTSIANSSNINHSML